MNAFALILMGLCLVYCNAETYKILYLTPFAARSHKNAFDPLIIELAKRGHQLTVVSPFKSSEPMKNIHDILSKKADLLETKEGHDQFLSTIGSHPILQMLGFKYFAVPSCQEYFKNPEMKNLLKQGQQFDVVIVNAFLNECAMATAPLLGKYLIQHSPAGIFSFSGVFIPLPPSYVPHMSLPYTSKMNFFQRLNNIVTIAVSQLIWDYQVVPAMNAEVTKHFPNIASIPEVKRTTSIVLTNSDPVLTSPRPTMPNVINVGGMHCSKAKPLPKELEDFVSTSGDDGFIYFSLGSNIKSKFLPAETKKSLLNAFSRLKQKVIWKFEEDLKDSPPNVKVTAWAPQQDILGHPKIRAFITHGGLLSLQETVYHGTPVVVVPLFGDQPSNAARVEELGIGIKLDYFNISGDSIFEAAKEILKSEYKENMKKYSDIFRDRFQDPIQEAAFWVEYVVRHDGARHLRSPGEDLNFFQYFLLDVIAFILAVVLTVLGALVYSAKFVIRKIFSKNKTAQNLKQKKRQ